ncbi:MFS transporter [Streptomyces echinatus]|uniref:Putative MFS family arabinose efflux permease n=1 Tax=Streptomyces echinatus TaxID=67293 RepID=A0A7W9PX80_9ACTN|nr:putative MFS family arabinose efflux permease [Streptomyces echinatus]
MRLPPRTALLVLLAVFLAGNVLAATATGYGVMLTARIVTGVASQAFFGVALSLCARLTRPEIRGRAVAVALNGLMLGTLLGLPLSTLIGERLGWRAAFWAVSVLALAAGAATAAGVPWLGPAPSGGLRAEAGVFARPRLWRAPATSTLVIGATFAAFSYFNPILTGLTGFPAATVPLLLIAYGAATAVVGRLADRYAVPVLAVGLLLNLLFLGGFAVLADAPVPAVVCLLGIGLVGVTMNPAMATRVQRAGNAGPLVNSVHTSFITLGVIVGSSLGAVALDARGLRAPLWLGAALAALGLLTVLPELRRTGGPARRGGTPVAHGAAAPEVRETVRRG